MATAKSITSVENDLHKFIIETNEVTKNKKEKVRRGSSIPTNVEQIHYTMDYKSFLEQFLDKNKKTGALTKGKFTCHNFTFERDYQNDETVVTYKQNSTNDESDVIEVVKLHDFLETGEKEKLEEEVKDTDDDDLVSEVLKGIEHPSTRDVQERPERPGGIARLGTLAAYRRTNHRHPKKGKKPMRFLVKKVPLEEIRSGIKYASFAKDRRGHFFRKTRNYIAKNILTVVPSKDNSKEERRARRKEVLDSWNADSKFIPPLDDGGKGDDNDDDGSDGAKNDDADSCGDADNCDGAGTSDASKKKKKKKKKKKSATEGYSEETSVKFIKEGIKSGLFEDRSQYLFEIINECKDLRRLPRESMLYNPDDPNLGKELALVSVEDTTTDEGKAGFMASLFLANDGKDSTGTMEKMILDAAAVISSKNNASKSSNTSNSTSISTSNSSNTSSSSNKRTKTKGANSSTSSSNKTSNSSNSSNTSTNNISDSNNTKSTITKKNPKSNGVTNQSTTGEDPLTFTVGQIVRLYPKVRKATEKEDYSLVRITYVGSEDLRYCEPSQTTNHISIKKQFWYRIKVHN